MKKTGCGCHVYYFHDSENDLVEVHTIWGARKERGAEVVAMILAAHEAALFYRAWWPLLAWVNDKKHVVPAFPTPTPERPIPLPVEIKFDRRCGLTMGFANSF